MGFLKLLVKAVASAIVAWTIDRGFDYITRRYAVA